jgi:hypothetical protein
MTLRKVAFSAVLFSASIYILLPTPDEFVIYPVLSLSFAYVFHLPIVYDILLSMILYRGLGAFCMLGALLIGGKPIYYKLKGKMKIRRTADQKKIELLKLLIMGFFKLFLCETVLVTSGVLEWMKILNKTIST